MKQPVIIKSSRYGITLMLDDAMPFEELLTNIRSKFAESEKFFGEANVAISFTGRELSDEEQSAIVDCISDSSSVNIICIVDHDEIADEVLQKKLGLVPEAPEPVPEEKEESRIFYRGSLVPGEEICSDGPVIIIGDVPVGAKVASDSNIIVLGRLAGSAFAGLSIDEERFEESPFIAALEFEPESYSIMGVYGKPVKPSKKGGIFSRNKASCGAIADIKDGFIAVHPLYER